MSCPESTAASAALTTALTGPARASADGQSVDQHRLTDLIEADRYLASKAAVNGRTRGLRFNRLVPDGTVHRRHDRDSPEWRDV